MQLLLQNLDSKRKTYSKITHQTKTWTGSTKNNGKMVVQTDRSENIEVYRAHLKNDKEYDRFEVLTYGFDSKDRMHSIELNLNHTEATQLLNQLTRQLLG